MIPSPSSEQTPWLGASSALVLLCIAAVVWWWPFVDAGSPYLYQEDEAHHYNRIVDMVRTGDLDPHYFHKPSLHFYLRIPAVVAGFLWEVRAGNARSVKEIRTKDPHGLAGYAFSASHPGVLRTSRLFTLLLSVLILFATYQLGAQLTGMPAAGIGASVLVLLSTEFSRYSAFIGVDTVMTLMAVTAVLAAVSCVRFFSLGTFIGASFVAGLAISSKYNALPIVIVPLLTLIACRRLDFLTLLLAILVPVLGFVAGSPFILTSLPLFSDQLAYEVWHYGIAGHVGHTAEPGLPQLMHYAWWLTGDGVGVVATFFAVAGLIFLFLRRTREGVVIAAFPLLFLLLMCAQRANFERNMIVLIPFVAVCASYGVLRALEVLPVRSAIRNSGYGALMLAATIQPFFQTVGLRHEILSLPETRRDAEAWLREQGVRETAVAGQLEFAASALRIAGVSVFDQEQQSLRDLVLAGYDRALVGPGFSRSPDAEGVATQGHSFQGDSEVQRVTANPTIHVYDLALPPELSPTLRSAVPPQGAILLQINAAGAGCKRADGNADLSEGHCWIEQRVGQIRVDPVGSAPRAGTLNLQIMSPWADQEVRFESPGAEPIAIQLAKQGEWQEIAIPTSPAVLAGTERVWVTVRHVRSPKEHQLSADARRLGVAVKNPRLIEPAPETPPQPAAAAVEAGH